MISDAGSSSSAAASPATSETFDATSGADGGVGIGGSVGSISGGAVGGVGSGGIAVGGGVSGVGDIGSCLKDEDAALNWYDDAVGFGGVGGSVGVSGAFAPVEDIVRFAGAGTSVAASALPPLDAADAGAVTSDAIFDDFEDVGRDNFALTG